MFSIFGVIWILCIPFRGEQSLSAAIKDLWNFYIPLVHSLISLFGVVTVCILTPFGTVHLVNSFFNYFEKYTSQKVTDYDPQINAMELQNLDMKLHYSNFKHLQRPVEAEHLRQRKVSLETKIVQDKESTKLSPVFVMLGIYCMLTILLVIVVIGHTVAIVVGLQALPKSRAENDIGLKPSSFFGWAGSFVQIVLIEYLLLSSIVGFYSAVPWQVFIAKSKSNDIQSLLRLAMLLQLLTCANPVQSRLLNVTVFNPLGTFGHFDWLDSAGLVLAYNIGFQALMLGSLLRLLYHSQHRSRLASAILARLLDFVHCPLSSRFRVDQVVEVKPL